MTFLGEAARDLIAILAEGARLLAREWPKLLAIALAGATLRGAAVWGAVVASDLNSTLGVMIVPLAPLATLASLVFMLRVCGESLPAFRTTFEAMAAPERRRSHIMIAAIVLVPFLTVYASQGLLKEDTVSFIRDVTLDETVSHFFRAHYDRTLIAEGWTLFAIVAIALVIRKVIAGYGLASKTAGWGLVAGYVEALWMVTLGATMTNKLNEGRDWMTSRVFMQPFMNAWEGLVAAKDQASVWIKVPVDFVGSVLSQMGDLIVIPVAWMAIGAMIYGSRLQAAEIPLGHEAMVKRINTLPNPVRRTAAHVVEPIATPVKDTWEAIKQVAAAGIVPMVLFCILFATTNQVRVGIAWIARLSMGPTDPWQQVALLPYVTLAERVAYLVVTVALLAAAVNRVVLSQTASATAEQVSVS